MTVADRFSVILTRLSRVTFTAAHEYLGLTTEVLRTEKAINDIASHPLPPSFYEGGGLQVTHFTYLQKSSLMKRTVSSPTFRH
jgi:hypothetical protein